LFAVGQPAVVEVSIGDWDVDFDFGHITSWSIGGGSVGTQAFRATFYDVSFSSASVSAVPEPASYALWAASAGLAVAVWRRRRNAARREGP
jgi:hypothetical protein